MSNFWDEIKIEIERSAPSSLAAQLDRTRPYDGQPHTDQGIRGATLVEGLTMRDLSDCFTRACFDASGMGPEDWPANLDDLPWDKMDIVAVRQCFGVWVEKYMGIYPNVPKVVK